MRQISPENMAALASRASSALERLAYGAPLDEPVRERLRGAEEFCGYLQNGLMSRRTPDKLSPTTVAEGELLELVFQFENQEQLEAKIPAVLKELSRLNTSKRLKQVEIEKLQNFFYEFAMKLNLVSGLHRKLASEVG